MALIVDIVVLEFNGSLFIYLLYFLPGVFTYHIAHIHFHPWGNSCRKKRIMQYAIHEIVFAHAWGLPTATTRKCFLLISTSQTFQATSSHMPASLTLSYHCPTVGNIHVKQATLLLMQKPFTEPRRTPCQEWGFLSCTVAPVVFDVALRICLS